MGGIGSIGALDHLDLIEKMAGILKDRIRHAS
jgi:hypothetical protein